MPMTIPEMSMYAASAPILKSTAALWISSRQSPKSATAESAWDRTGDLVRSLSARHLPGGHRLERHARLLCLKEREQSPDLRLVRLAPVFTYLEGLRMLYPRSLALTIVLLKN